MLKAFCDVCKKPIEGDEFEQIEVPLNGTGKVVVITSTERGFPSDFHVHTRCVFDSIRAAERRLNEPKAEAR